MAGESPRGRPVTFGPQTEAPSTPRQVHPGTPRSVNQSARFGTSQQVAAEGEQRRSRSPAPQQSPAEGEQRRSRSPAREQNALARLVADNRNPVKLIKGERIEYYSQTEKTWVPAVIMTVNNESGAITIDLKPQTPIHKHDQTTRLRSRTVPSQDTIAYLRKIQNDGYCPEKSKALFKKHADKNTKLICTHEAKRRVCKDLDEMLGVSGTICDFSRYEQINVDHFQKLFIALVWTIQKTFGNALKYSLCIEQVNSDPARSYEFLQKLGEGTYGEAYLAECKKTKMTRAIKIIRSSGNDKNAEIKYLIELDHPNIVKLHAYFEWKQNIYIVMDFCGEGELYEFIRKRKAQNNNQANAKSSISESFIGDLLRQCLLAIAHVHARGIMHLDLKPKNIMLTKMKDSMGTTLAPVGERGHVMIIDLGVAQYIKPGNKIPGDAAGTPYYMAPEVWQGNLTPKADVFSLGVVLYEMLTLQWPFHVNAGQNYEDAIKFWKAQIKKPSLPWYRLQHASENAANMCHSMMELTIDSRPTADKCLQDPFMESLSLGQVGDEKLKNYVKRMLKFPRRSLLYKCVALATARKVPNNELQGIKQLFHHLKTTGDMLQKSSVSGFLRKHKANKNRAADAAEHMDMNQDGGIEWTEFIAACISLGDDEYFWWLKSVFSSAGNGQVLTKQNIVDMLVLSNKSAKDKEEEALKCFQELGDGRNTPKTDSGQNFVLVPAITWETFRRYFQGDRVARDNAHSPGRNAPSPRNENETDSWRPENPQEQKYDPLLGRRVTYEEMIKLHRGRESYWREKCFTHPDHEERRFDPKLDRFVTYEAMIKLRAEKFPREFMRRVSDDWARLDIEKKYDPRLQKLVTYEEMVKDHRGAVKEAYWDHECIGQEQLKIGDRVKVLPTKRFESDGVERFRENDVGSVERIQDDNGTQKVTIKWERTQLGISIATSVWKDWFILCEKKDGAPLPTPSSGYEHGQQSISESFREALRKMTKPALIRYAMEIGVDEDALEIADEGPKEGIKEGIIELILEQGKKNATPPGTRKAE